MVGVGRFVGSVSVSVVYVVSAAPLGWVAVVGRTTHRGDPPRGATTETTTTTNIPTPTTPHAPAPRDEISGSGYSNPLTLIIFVRVRMLGCPELLTSSLGAGAYGVVGVGMFFVVVVVSVSVVVSVVAPLGESPR